MGRRWPELTGEHTFFYGKRNENHKLGTGLFVHKKIISAVRKVESVQACSQETSVSTNLKKQLHSAEERRRNHKGNVGFVSHTECGVK
jgi:hypothetical protein